MQRTSSSRALLFTILMMFICANGMTGAGTNADPYMVSTYSDLKQVGVGSYTLSATYRLANDIDASPSRTEDSLDGVPHGFSPIGPSSFKGAFHGGGHVIHHLYIYCLDCTDVGLFAQLIFGVVDSLGLEDISVTGSTAVGGLVGTNEDGKVRASYSSGYVNGLNDVGGLVGYNWSGEIYSSFSSVAVIGDSVSSNVGGLVGLNDLYGEVHGSYSTGSVKTGFGSTYVGGLIGQNGYGSIDSSYSISSVTVGAKSRQVGGFVGVNKDSVNQCNSTGFITTGSQSTYVGGLVGFNQGKINRSYSLSHLNGQEFIGGLVGKNDGLIYAGYSKGFVKGDSASDYIGGITGQNAGTIQKSYSSDSVEGGASSNYLGGLIGWNGGKVSDDYSIGVITSGRSSKYLGGFMGGNVNSVRSCYSTSSVVVDSSSLYVGGFVGFNDTYAVIDSSHWDMQASGVSIDGSQSTAIGETTAMMKKQETFVGWNFDSTWIMIADSRPLLRVFNDTATNATSIISHLVPAKASVSYARGFLNFRNLQGHVDLFNIHGKNVYSFIAENSGTITISLFPGVYILRSKKIAETFVVGAW